MHVRNISLKEKNITLESGEKVKWDLLVTTIPLPELIYLSDKKSELMDLMKRLKWVSVYNLNLGVAGELVQKFHWANFPQEEFPFYRVGIPSNISSENAPEGTYSLSIDISHSTHRKLGKEIDSKVTKCLKKVGLLQGDIMVKHDEVTPFGYVIFDRYWKTTREKIANFLQRFDVYAIGRYGSWTYSMMQDALYDGFRIIDKLKRKHVG